ncbi:hypothetical protein [Catellatospora sichuanensis]|uniref:hypothetical protein n=1 Tax=Catellatospora sichuanensis TaxID=1969805 RepID=UPI001182EADF|nr:hypothetical protein [Catellatospora sichuanensis]
MEDIDANVLGLIAQIVPVIAFLMATDLVRDSRWYPAMDKLFASPGAPRESDDWKLFFRDDFFKNVLSVTFLFFQCMAKMCILAMMPFLEFWALVTLVAIGAGNKTPANLVILTCGAFMLICSMVLIRVAQPLALFIVLLTADWYAYLSTHQNPIRKLLKKSGWTDAMKVDSGDIENSAWATTISYVLTFQALLIVYSGLLVKLLSMLIETNF